MNVYTCTRASSTLNASSVGKLIITADKLFHVRIAEGKYEFWWLCILENGICTYLDMFFCSSGGCRSKMHLRWYGYKVVDYPLHCVVNNRIPCTSSENEGCCFCYFVIVLFCLLSNITLVQASK